MSKHPHYELLNLIGYGLAKFDDTFIKEFQCSSKSGVLSLHSFFRR